MRIPARFFASAFVFAAVIFLSTCVVDADDPFTEKAGEGANAIFQLESENGVVYKPFLVSDNTIHIAVPNGADLADLTPHFMGAEITAVNGTEKAGEKKSFDFSDFVHPLSFTVRENGVAQEYTIVLYDLPVLTIDTPDGEPILSKTERTEDCEMRLALSDGTIHTLAKAGIKVRGNSTSLQPKKPYNIKFDFKQSLLGMKSSKKWVLLANAYYDRTQLHNATAFEVARLTDFPWVQSGEFVELVLNDGHRGLYYLCEKIDIEEGKIGIDEIASGYIDSYGITGGYLLEGAATNDVGYFPNDGLSFATDYYNATGTKPWGLYWFLKNPDKDVPAEQLKYIKNQMNTLERLVSGIGYDDYTDNENTGGGYLEYLDIGSAVNWYLVEELCLNEEASRTKNCYLYKKRGDEKMYFGPPWDFDAWTFGFTGTKKFYVKPYAWCFSVLFKDAEFVSRVKEKWALYNPLWKEKIPAFIHEQYGQIHRAAERNEVMWTDWHSVNAYPEKSYHQLVMEMESAFIAQLEWMDAEIEKM